MVAEDCTSPYITKTWSRSGNWEAVRRTLLDKRICDLRLRIKGSPLEPFIRQLERELPAKNISFVPDFYLTDSWGCPDKVPVVGILFTCPAACWGVLRKSRPASWKTAGRSCSFYGTRPGTPSTMPSGCGKSQAGRRPLAVFPNPTGRSFRLIHGAAGLFGISAVTHTDTRMPRNIRMMILQRPLPSG